MDSIGRFMAVILAIVFVLILPLTYISISQGETMNHIVEAHATEFTDVTLKQGYITIDLYEKFIDNLDRTGELYDIAIEVTHPVSGKELQEVTLEDKLPGIKAEKISSQQQIKGDILKEELRLMAAHTHTDACYNGMKHVCSSYGGSCYSSYSYSCNGCQYKTTYCGGCSTKVTYCSGCVKEYYGWTWCSCYFTNHPGYADKEKTIVCGCMDGADYGWYAGYNWVCNGHSTTYCPGHQTLYCPGTHIGYTKICGKVSDAYYNGNSRVYEACDKVVISISPTNPTQELLLGETIVSTATATYLDGHTSTINCSNDFSPSLTGIQNVTLTFSGLVGDAKTTGTRTCKVIVTVNMPYKLTGITVTPLTQEIPRYTNPLFTLEASYDNGTRKEVTGYRIDDFNPNIVGEQSVKITYTEDGITKDTTVKVTVSKLTVTCPVCNTAYELDELDQDNGCPVCKGTIDKIVVSPLYIEIVQGEELNISVQAIYRDGTRGNVIGWTSDFDPNVIGIQEVTVTYREFSARFQVNVKSNHILCSICKREYPLEKGIDTGCPYCKMEVVGIEASPKRITMEKHNPLPITVTATFRDGHKEVISDWTTDFVSDTSGTYEVSIYYKSAVTQIVVTVLEENLHTCPFCGLEYVFKDSPEGCPICYYTIVGIEASLRNGSKQVPYRSGLNLEIVIIFQDTHREITYDGWAISGYRSDELGVQLVTVHYNNFSTNLTIEVVDNQLSIVCLNGHEYYLNEDTSDPGCPICNSTKDRENAVFYFDITYTNDILHTLYTEGIYYFKEGDYITVSITVRSISIRTKLVNILLSRKEDSEKHSFTYGGEVIIL